MPVIAATDVASDVGLLAEENGFGARVLSNEIEGFIRAVDEYAKNKDIIS